ncbi:hypothetical protein LCGC14_3101020, partial [marine sediment metagenome]
EVQIEFMYDRGPCKPVLNVTEPALKNTGSDPDVLNNARPVVTSRPERNYLGGQKFQSNKVHT